MNHSSEVTPYDHNFVCLSSGLDPESISHETAALKSSLTCSSAGEMIHQNVDRIPEILRKHVDLLASDFSWYGYKQRNQDLRHLSPKQLVEHFLNHGIRETRHWNSRATLLDRRYAWAIHSSSDTHLQTKIQVIVHVYHYDVLCLLLPYLRILARLGAKIYFFVSNILIAESVLDQFAQALYTGFTKHEWLRVENHGEDWSSFHEAHQLGLFNHNGITYKIQTKKSSNLGSDGGLAWIDEALGPLCGTQGAIKHTLDKLSDEFSSIAASGAIARVGFGENPLIVDYFIDRLCMEQPSSYYETNFASGSMFAVKNSQANRFFSKLGKVDYSKTYDQGSEYCGRYAGHALERVFFYYASDHPAQSTVYNNNVCWL